MIETDPGRLPEEEAPYQQGQERPESDDLNTRPGESSEEDQQGMPAGTPGQMASGETPGSNPTHERDSEQQES
jgi:hypothetical protein